MYGIGSKMIGRRCFQSLIVAASMLGMAGAAHATVQTLPFKADGTNYLYSTYYDVPANSSSPVYAGANTFLGGGLCQNNVSPCASQTPLMNSNYGEVTTGGTLTATGLIEITTPSTIANWLLTLTVTNTKGSGDIYNVVVNGGSLGNTSAVASDSSTHSTGTFSIVINGGNVPIYIGITDLRQEYFGSSSYNLPWILDPTDFTNQPVSLASDTDTQSQFILAGSLVLDPEPASLSIFALGSLALGAARRRQRAKAAKTAA